MMGVIGVEMINFVSINFLNRLSFLIDEEKIAELVALKPTAFNITHQCFAMFRNYTILSVSDIVDENLVIVADVELLFLEAVVDVAW